MMIAAVAAIATVALAAPLAAPLAPITGTLTTDASSLYTAGVDQAIKQTAKFADLNTADAGTPAFEWTVTAALEDSAPVVVASGSRPANTLTGATVSVPITGAGMYDIELMVKPAGAADFYRLHSRQVRVYAEPCALLQNIGATTKVTNRSLSISRIVQRNIGDAEASGVMTIRIQDGGTKDPATGKWTWPDADFHVALDGVLVNVPANSTITLPGVTTAVRPGLCNVEISIPNDGIGGDGGRTFQVNVK